MRLSPETIEQLARQAFPEATLVSHRLLEGGVAHLNYALQLQDPSTEVALRVYGPDTPRGRLDKEMYVLRVIMPETGVPTPRVIHFDDSRALVNRPYAVLNLLPGGPLAQVIDRMDALDQETTGYEMGRYLAKLHSIPLEKFGEFLGEDPQASVNEKAYTVARAMAWLEVCEEKDLLEESTTTAVRRFVRQTRALNRHNACFVHGDYYAENVNVEEGIGGFHVTGVFDFAHAQGWSPEWDMGTLLSDLADDYPTLAKGFLDGYADTRGLPEDLWERLRVYQAMALVGQLIDADRRGDESSLQMRQARVHRFLEQEPWQPWAQW
jgi:aminoglycoside phosphotransferase (APT) family kinase protein